jgi:calcium-dependent protein kinase
LGKGQFGTARLAKNRQTGQTVAIKTINKRKLLTEEDCADIVREIEIMHHLAGHPNIVRLYGAFEDADAVHLAMELATGGELFDRIVKRGHYTERDAAAAARTIVGIVQHCHSMGVIHRDLKPENMLLDSDADDAVLKATDFGLSAFFREGQVFSDIVGSAFYVAPEVLRRSYGPAADLWSCGVILYILLCGVPPFYANTEQGIFEQVIRGRLDLESAPWPQISEPAKDCVRRLLVRDPRKRATAAEILAHPWLKEDGVASDVPLVPEVLSRIRGFAGMNRLKREALRLVASTLPPDEIAGLREMFRAIDTDGSGTVTAEELKAALERKGGDIPRAELEGLMAMVDADSSGCIAYDEWLAATLHQGRLEQGDALLKAFNAFDKDGSGYLSADELRQALRSADGPAKKRGQQAAEDEAELKRVLAECDRDGDGRVSYAEFCAMFLGEDTILAGDVATQQHAAAAVAASGKKK